MRWPEHPATPGTTDPTPAGAGVVLDLGPHSGTWWCSPGGGALPALVKARYMSAFTRNVDSVRPGRTPPPGE